MLWNQIKLVNLPDEFVGRGLLDLTCKGNSAPAKRGKKIVVTPGSVFMNVDGVNVPLDQPAFITAMSRMMVPLRAVGENQAYAVDWDGERAILTDRSG